MCEKAGLGCVSICLISLSFLFLEVNYATILKKLLFRSMHYATILKQ
jgi:hypothetical protein